MSKRLEKDEIPNEVPESVLLSVRVTTYNHEKYIAQALDSILMQKTSFPFEICIGEDDSTDATRSICLEYAQKYPKVIRLFCRNAKDKIYVEGIMTGKYNGSETRKACRGKYIALLEGDDYWVDPYKLQKQYDYLEAHQECACVVGRAFRQNEVDSSRSRIVPKISETGIQQYRDLLSETFNVHTCTMCYRRNGFDYNDSIFKRARASDLLTMLLLTENGHVFYCDPAVFAVYRITGSGAWTSINRADGLQTKINIWRLYQERCIAKESKSEATQIEHVLRRLQFERNWLQVDSKAEKYKLLFVGLCKSPTVACWFIKRLIRW